MGYYSALLPHLNLVPCFSADTPPLSDIHIKQLSPTFTWHYFRRLSSHLYLAHILSLPFHLNMTLFRSFHFVFSADITTPLSVTLLLYLSPPLSVTFFLHLLPYYSTLMWHFPRASPRSISPHLNMASFSLCFYHTFTWHWSFLSHLGSITLRSFSRAFPRRTLPTFPWVLHSPQLFRGGFFTIFFAFTWILSFHGSLWIIAF